MQSNDPLGFPATELYLPPGDTVGNSDAASTPQQALARCGNIPNIPGYEISGELGRGGMGVVYRARDVKLNRDVALKMVLSGAFASEEERLRFLIEAEMAARVKHPNIAQVYQVGTYEERPYYALEFVSGGSLRDRWRSQQPTAREAAALVEILARAA